MQSSTRLRNKIYSFAGRILNQGTCEVNKFTKRHIMSHLLSKIVSVCKFLQEQRRVNWQLNCGFLKIISFVDVAFGVTYDKRKF